MGTILTGSGATLLELANQIGPDGNLIAIAEVLNKNNPMLQEFPWVQANDTFSNKGLKRLSLPQATWRRLNQGVGKGNTLTLPFTDVIGMLAIYSQADAVLVDAAPNPELFRFNRAKAFIEGMSQQLASGFFYSNAAVDTEMFTGLAPRLDAIKEDHVISAGGTGSDLTSIYIACAGEDKVHFIYPKGHPQAGIRHVPKGIVTVQDDDGKEFEAYKDYFEAMIGLVVEDDRYIKRVCNIETSGTSNTFDEDLLIQATEAIPEDGLSSAVIMCNRKIRTQARIRLKDKANVHWTVEQGLSGVRFMAFDGIPVVKCDAILNTETQVS